MVGSGFAAVPGFRRRHNRRVVAVSLLAPFAVIELGEVVVFEDGSTTEAEIEPYGD